MAEERIEDETYSTIFSSLKHPLRRKILRMMVDSPMSFSEILNALSIDSGHLSYHLENLGDLITHTNENKYKLSSVGIAAVRLMSGVEEHPSPPHQSSFAFRGIAKAYVIIILAALIAFSIFPLAYPGSAGGQSLESFPGLQMAILPGQKFQFNITITYIDRPEHISRGGITYISIQRPPPVDTFWLWEECSAKFSINYNDSDRTIRSRIRVYDSSGAILVNYDNTSLRNIQRSFPIRKAGIYRIEIENLVTEELMGGWSYSISWEMLQRPFFFFGVLGLMIAGIYPVYAITRRILKSRLLNLMNSS